MEPMRTRPINKIYHKALLNGSHPIFKESYLSSERVKLITEIGLQLSEKFGD